MSDRENVIRVPLSEPLPPGRYILDKAYRNKSVVILISCGKVFATVQAEEGGTSWGVMANRLTKIEEGDET